MRCVRLPIVALVLWAGSSWCAAAPGPAPAGAERLDAAKWTRRNLDVLRRKMPEERGKEELITVSLHYNPLLKRDPYAVELAAIIEPYVRPGAADARRLGDLVKKLRRPQAERLELLREESEGRRLEREAGPVLLPRTVAQVILGLRPRERAEREAALLEKMEAVARERQDWGKLGLAYLTLASYVEPGHPERAEPYLRRLLEVLRDHPILQDPRDGNGDAVLPLDVARVMLRRGRREALEQFIHAAGGDLGTELATALAATLARDGDFESARDVIKKQVRPASAKNADQVEAVLKGEVLPAPKRGGDDPVERRLLEALRTISPGHAVRGDVETAARVEISLQDKKLHDPPNALASYEWANLARLALEGGHEAQARRALGHAIEAMNGDAVLGAAEHQEREWLAREALSLREYELPVTMFNSGGPAGAWGRLELSRAYRGRGDLPKARAAIEDALRCAYSPDTTEGGVMAEIAVDLKALGDERRAERVLLDALPRIAGEDFGFGGTRAVVEAAVKMNRLDLLDRLYEQSTPDYQMLLCVMATQESLLATGGDRLDE